MSIEKADIRDRVSALARDIKRYPLDRAVIVLKGALHFGSDLLRHMANQSDGKNVDLSVEFVIVSTYEGKKRVREPKILFRTFEDVSGQRILLIEDIADSGFTLAAVKRDLELRGAMSIRTVALLVKSGCEQPVEHWGFEIPADWFAVGYGLDDNGDRRHELDISFI